MSVPRDLVADVVRADTVALTTTMMTTVPTSPQSEALQLSSSLPARPAVSKIAAKTLLCTYHVSIEAVSFEIVGGVTDHCDICSKVV